MDEGLPRLGPAKQISRVDDGKKSSGSWLALLRVRKPRQNILPATYKMANISNRGPLSHRKPFILSVPKQISSSTNRSLSMDERSIISITLVHHHVVILVPTGETAHYLATSRWCDGEGRTAGKTASYGRRPRVGTAEPLLDAAPCVYAHLGMRGSLSGSLVWSSSLTDGKRVSVCAFTQPVGKPQNAESLAHGPSVPPWLLSLN